MSPRAKPKLMLAACIACPLLATLTVALPVDPAPDSPQGPPSPLDQGLYDKILSIVPHTDLDYNSLTMTKSDPETDHSTADSTATVTGTVTGTVSASELARPECFLLNPGLVSCGADVWSDLGSKAIAAKPTTSTPSTVAHNFHRRGYIPPLTWGPDNFKNWRYHYTWYETTFITKTTMVTTTTAGPDYTDTADPTVTATTTHWKPQTDVPFPKLSKIGYFFLHIKQTTRTLTNNVLMEATLTRPTLEPTLSTVQHSPGLTEPARPQTMSTRTKTTMTVAVTSTFGSKASVDPRVISEIDVSKRSELSKGRESKSKAEDEPKLELETPLSIFDLAHQVFKLLWRRDTHKEGKPKMSNADKKYEEEKKCMENDPRGKKIPGNCKLVDVKGHVACYRSKVVNGTMVLQHDAPRVGKANRAGDVKFQSQKDIREWNNKHGGAPNPDTNSETDDTERCDMSKYWHAWGPWKDDGGFADVIETQCPTPKAKKKATFEPGIHAGEPGYGAGTGANLDRFGNDKFSLVPGMDPKTVSTLQMPSPTSVVLNPTQGIGPARPQ